MRVLSLALLVAGWFLVIAAIAMLRPEFIAVFVVAGIAVETLGLVLLSRENAFAVTASIALQERR